MRALIEYLILLLVILIEIEKGESSLSDPWED